MDINIFTSVFLPISLIIIMFGMGMSLTIQDFKRIALYPKAVFVGLLNQLFILPLIGLLVISIYPLSPEFKIGLLILTFCPGGTTSNLISYLAKADLALSITLTAFSSLVTVFTIPLFTNWSMTYFLGTSEIISIPVGKTMLQLFVITILPVGLGMWVKIRFRKFALKSEKYVGIMSATFFILVVLLSIAADWERLMIYLQQVTLVVLLLNIVTMVIGFIASTIFLLNARQRLTITLETGLQNATLAILVTGTIIGNTQMIIIPAVYGLLMFAPAFLLVFLARKL